MHHEDFLSLVEKQKRLEAFASNYSERNLPSQEDREPAKKALLSRFREASALLAEEKFAEAFANGTLVSDRAAMLEAVSVQGWGLEFASPSLKSNREIAIKALETSFVLHLVGPEFQDDKPLVLSCVKVVGRSLESASPRLKADREIVLAAVCQKPSSIRFASEELKCDKALVLEGMKHEDMFDAPMLYYASRTLWHDAELLKATEENELRKKQRIESMRGVWG